MVLRLVPVHRLVRADEDLVEIAVLAGADLIRQFDEARIEADGAGFFAAGLPVGESADQAGAFLN